MQRHRLPIAAAAAAAAGTYAAVVRPHLVRWGATEQEAGARLPGDELIPEPLERSTFATTLDAPPSGVWPWLVQMGCDRAGFYSFDHLDNGGVPSAEEIHPEWQQLAEGDHMTCLPDGSAWFDVGVLEPERTLVLRQSMTPGGKRFDPEEPPPRAYIDSTWGFHLRPAPGGGTRLIVRGIGRGRPRALTRASNWLFWEPAHWVMQVRQFAELRCRTRSSAPVRSSPGGRASA